MSDDPSHVPAPRDRREAVREKAQQVRVQQSRARAIRMAVLSIAVVAVVAVAAVVVTWVVGSDVSKPQVAPAAAFDDGFQVGEVTGVVAAAGSLNNAATDAAAEPAPEPTPEPTPSATERTPVDIRVYVDYLSDGAADFQLANAQQLASWVEKDAATLTYFPVAMLTSKSNGTKYSLRAASAAACVGTHSPDEFFAFNHELLAKRPAVDSDGLPDEVLADIAIASGASSPKGVRACIEEERYASWAKAATERALKELPATDGLALTGTPMVLVNGKAYVGALDDPAEFAQFVLTIGSDAYYQTPTPTPSPTATTTPTPTATP